MTGLHDATPAAGAIDAQVTRLRREVDGLISVLRDKERVARSTYERDVPGLRDQLGRNEQKIQKLQRENEAARNKVTQLRNAYEAATESRRKVEAVFGGTCENTSPPRTPLQSTAASNAEIGAATTQQQEGLAEGNRPNSPNSPTETATTQRPVTRQATRRSTRDRRAPRRLSPTPRSARKRTPGAAPELGAPANPIPRATGKGNRYTETPPASGQRGRKRKRVAHDEGTQASRASKQKKGEKNKNGKQGQMIQHAKTVDFGDVFQDGRAQYKHKIVQYPEKSGDWFILRCDDHHVHFGYKSILSAARHLSSEVHGRLPQGTSIAIRELGIRVLNCDAAKAGQNNAVFSAALRNGYKVLKGKLSVGAERSEPQAAAGSQGESHDDLGVDQPIAQQTPLKSKPFDGITNPVVGELYLGYWRSPGASGPPSDWYAVVVLPIGDFTTVGISGSIFDTHLTKNHIPTCYDSDRTTQTIFGWAEGYKDCQVHVTKRRFPVMYFDDDQEIQREGDFQVPFPDSLAWLPASQLRCFSAYGPENLPARGYDVALGFSERLSAIRAAQALPGDTLTQSRDKTTAYGSNHSDVSVFLEASVTSHVGPARKDGRNEDGRRAVGDESQSTFSAGPRGPANKNIAKDSDVSDWSNGDSNYDDLPSSHDSDPEAQNSNSEGMHRMPDGGGPSLADPVPPVPDTHSMNIGNPAIAAPAVGDSQAAYPSQTQSRTQTYQAQSLPTHQTGLHQAAITELEDDDRERTAPNPTAAPDHAMGSESATRQNDSTHSSHNPKRAVRYGADRATLLPEDKQALQRPPPIPLTITSDGNWRIMSKALQVSIAPSNAEPPAPLSLEQTARRALGLPVVGNGVQTKECGLAEVSLVPQLTQHTPIARPDDVRQLHRLESLSTPDTCLSEHGTDTSPRGSLRGSPQPTVPHPPMPSTRAPKGVQHIPEATFGRQYGSANTLPSPHAREVSKPPVETSRVVHILPPLKANPLGAVLPGSAPDSQRDRTTFLGAVGGNEQEIIPSPTDRVNSVEIIRPAAQDMSAGTNVGDTQATPKAGQAPPVVQAALAREPAVSTLSNGPNPAHWQGNAADLLRRGSSTPYSGAVRTDYSSGHQSNRGPYPCTYPDCEKQFGLMSVRDKHVEKKHAAAKSSHDANSSPQVMELG